MWRNTILIGLFVIFGTFTYQVAEATMCYQCDSWEKRGCGEDDTMDEQYLVPCSFQYQVQPTTCLKEVTTFLPGQVQGQLDPQNRYGRPHVMRRCGISVIPNYRAEDYYDKCQMTQVIVNGLKAERLSCSCSDDACNSAISSNLINSTVLLGAIISSLIFSNFF